MRRHGTWVLVCALACCKRAERTELEAASSRSSPLPAAPGAASASSVPPQPTGSAAATPVPEKLPGTVRFAAIGDYGANSPDELRVASMVKSWKPDFVVTMGDNNYPDGAAATIDTNIGKYYAEFIGSYRGKYGPGSTTNRFWPCIGNHDWVSGLAPYLEYFTLPGNERYYDVDLGLIHLFAVDSDAHEPDGTSADSVQAKWLKDTLSKSKACYDVVFFHHPAYSSSRHGSSENMRWPFRDWGADVVMAGHDHTYERLVVDRIPYFVNGLGGASEYPFREATLPETQARYNQDYGAMLVDATKTAISYTFYSADGVKRDSLTLPAPAACAK